MIDAARMIQVGAGAVGLYAGYKVGSSVIQSAYREDLTGAPSRVVEIDGEWVVDQRNDPQAGNLTKAFMGVGGLLAGVGAALVLGQNPTMAARSLARATGGALLFAAGTSLIAGSVATSTRYQGTDVRPRR